MTTTSHPFEVKRIGETGQVSVGKGLAGKLVRVEPAPEGILLRFVVDVSEKNAWWLEEPYKSKLKDALAWAAKNPPAETDLDALLARATKGRGPARKPKRRTPRKSKK